MNTTAIAWMWWLNWRVCVRLCDVCAYVWMGVCYNVCTLFYTAEALFLQYHCVFCVSLNLPLLHFMSNQFNSIYIFRACQEGTLVLPKQKHTSVTDQHVHNKMSSPFYQWTLFSLFVCFWFCESESVPDADVSFNGDIFLLVLQTFAHRHTVQFEPAQI